MRARWVREHIVSPGLALVRLHMRSTGAQRMLLAIGFQESAFEHRVQLTGRHWWLSDGPARGWWQFERAGVTGVLNHPAAKGVVRDACQQLKYPAQTEVIHPALAHCDMLAVVFARALLWTVPEPLPEYESPAWEQYLWAWRPGKPDRGRWSESWQRAREAING